MEEKYLVGIDPNAKVIGWKKYSSIINKILCCQQNVDTGDLL